MQVVMLAAGMGKRLAKFTQNNTKCMVEVAGRKLIDFAIDSIKLAGIKRFVVVVGYKAENLKKYLIEKYNNELELVFIENNQYDTTNNIYSFFLAKNELVKDDTILLESDIIFDSSIIKQVVESKDKNCAVVAKYESWMDGTCVDIDKNNDIKKFYSKEDVSFKKMSSLYKTVNIYKFSREFLVSYYLPFLEAYIKGQGLDAYYETTLKVICSLPGVSLKAFQIGKLPWYEIDDAQDLDIANVLFSHGKDKYNLLMSKFGGYWRYGNILDFCYLVNPYFPPNKLIEKLSVDLPTLISQYPSGENIQNLNAERMFGVDRKYILVGNGAAELINSLGHITNGSVAVNCPSFNEYMRCFKHCNINKIQNFLNDFKLSLDEIKESLKSNDVVAIVSPDNPSGYMLSKDDIFDILDFAKKVNKKVIIDESFVDFANKEKRFTLLDNSILEKYPNLIVIKSISKSYGIPGLRLGVMATSDEELIKKVRDDMQVWNINSFAEYYLQIYNLFSKDYLKSCDLIALERSRVINELSKIKSIKVYDSEANYLMVDLGSTNSYEFCVNVLEESNILLKDLSSKDGFDNRNFVRIAIRDMKDNDLLIKTIAKILH